MECERKSSGNNSIEDPFIHKKNSPEIVAENQLRTAFSIKVIKNKKRTKLGLAGPKCFEM